jgi:hypothetical protein
MKSVLGTICRSDLLDRTCWHAGSAFWPLCNSQQAAIVSSHGLVMDVAAALLK